MRSSPLKRSGMDHTVFTLQTHHTCLYLVSVHQTALPVTTVVAAVFLQLHSFIVIDPKRMKGWVGLVSWPTANVLYPYKWLPISCVSGAGQEKFAGQRPTFYHWAITLTYGTAGCQRRLFRSLREWLYRVVQKVRHCIADGNFVNYWKIFNFFTIKMLTKFPTRYM